MAQEQEPDLILLDVNLPDINGFEVCRRLKSEPSTQHIPILQISATYLDANSRAKGLNGGADSYLTQPVEPPVLTATIRSLLRMKQAEAELRETAELYKDLIEHSRALICTHDLEGRILSVNQWASEALGIDREGLLSMNLRDILAPETKDQFDQYLATIRREGSAEGLMLILTSSGERRIWEYHNTLRTEGVKEPIVRGVAFDVTESKQIEKALRKSEERLQLAIEGSNAGLWDMELDPANPYEIPEKIYLSPRLKGFIGFCDDEFPNSLSAWQKRVFPEDLEILKRLIKDHLEGRTETYEGQYRIYHKDGSIRWIHTRGKIKRDEKGVPKRFVGINWDITEKKKSEEEMASLQEQLRQSQRIEAIGQLAAGVAHDFNNLLTVIQGNAQLSLLDLHEKDPLRANLEEIQEAARKAGDLTRQLLAFSRKQILDVQVLDLNQVLEKIQKILRRMIGEDIDLQFVFTDPLGRVRADRGQIEQVIFNLAVNARDAMPKGGKLTIETNNVELDEEYCRKHLGTEPGSYVMLSVSDTGIGMTPEVKERIFEPFFTTKEKGRGTGLGLSTVYGIVKQSGGTIWVYSEPGLGTTFKIYLPRVDEEAEEPKEEVPAEISGGNETILIVEDEEAVRKWAARILKSLGYKVLEAPDGGKAFMLCEKYGAPIHLVLSDVVMPGMNGRALVARLQMIHPEMKALYMSGYTDNVIAIHGILEPGINFIPKPFTRENLASKVREVLDKEK